MFEVDELIRLIFEYGYIIIFLGTLINYSGIPVFIVLAGLLYSTGKLDLQLTVLSFLIALVIIDLLLFKVGKYFADRQSRYLFKAGVKGFFYKLLLKGSRFFLSNQTIFYLFSKLIPILGKYTPVIAGYTDKPFLKAMVMFFIGDCIYSFSFFISAFFIGELILEYSLIVGLLNAGVFFLIYTIFYLVNKRRVKKKIND
ncbi:DedA family protein [Natroniella sp. ANB-PHB2]|uniref:DedA family protein n=1 Tax=Natroniella sp. ANB-PHB2 TaxID=3384444 RepID=UPI0038D43132